MFRWNKTNVELRKQLSRLTEKKKTNDKCYAGIKRMLNLENDYQG